MNSNKEKAVKQSTADEIEIASYQKKTTNKEKCENSQELPFNQNNQYESTKGKIWNQYKQN